MFLLHPSSVTGQNSTVSEHPLLCLPGLDYQIKNLVVDNKRFALRLWDSAGQER